VGDREAGGVPPWGVASGPGGATTVPPFVLHCFAGTADDARRASGLGAYFGVDGPVTYKRADGLREVLSGLPRDRVVIETDAPYLTPHPFRGERNHPRHIPLIGAKVGEVWGGNAEEQLTSNSVSLFPKLAGLPE